MQNMNENSKVFLVSACLMVSACYGTSIYLYLPVHEREMKLKYLLNVMGCKGLSYWLGNMLFDFIFYIISMAIFIISILAFKISFITDIGKYIVFCFWLKNYLINKGLIIFLGPAFIS